MSFRIYSLVIILLLISGQSVAGDCQLSSFSNIEGRFKQLKKLSFFPEPIISEGRYAYQRDVGLQWITESPVYSELLFSDDGLLINGRSQSHGDEVNRIIANIFLGLFDGSITRLKAYFSFRQLDLDSGWLCQLTPMSQSISTYVKSIELSGFDSVEVIRVLEANGNHTQITLHEKVGR